MNLSCSSQMIFLFNLLFQLFYMTFFYILSLLLSNGSFVDFAWPSSFSIMALFYIFFASSYPPRKFLLSSLYLLAGVRFITGWLKRGHLKKEDNRWSQWRTLWRESGGFFGIRNEKINTFIFFHAQSLANGLFMSAPLEIASRNSQEKMHMLEIVGVVIWIIAFWLENVADMQRLRFVVRMKKEGKGWGGVNREGLWGYSRHPNYFCEFMIWIAYCVYTIPSIEKLGLFVFLR